jgi:hypothetical protein
MISYDLLTGNSAQGPVAWLNIHKRIRDNPMTLSVASPILVVFYDCER